MNEWIYIRSWHIIRTWTRVPGRAITLCGRTTLPEQALLILPEPPADQRTCESCFRIRERA